MAMSGAPLRDDQMYISAAAIEKFHKANPG